jgi:hypothetical protein
MFTIIARREAKAVEYGYYEYRAAPAPLNDINGVGQESVWAVGDNGVILHYDGTQWQQEESGVDTSLYNICALDETHAYAVGYGATCLYRNGTRWISLEGIPSSKQVQCLPSGEVWVLSSSDIYRLNGTNWEAMDLSFKGILISFSVINETQMWLMSYHRKSSIYAYQYNDGELTEHLIAVNDNYPGLELSSGDIFALDKNRAWLCYQRSLSVSGLWGAKGYGTYCYDGQDWQECMGGIKVRTSSDLEVFTATGWGVYKISENQHTLVEETVEPVAGIYPYGNGEYWALEGNSIRHYKDWPLSNSPVGCKSATTLAYGTTPGKVYTLNINVTVQPISQDFVLYIIVKTPNGSLHSILPQNVITNGIRPYGRHFGNLESETSIKVLSRGLQRELPSGEYQTAVILMPVGRKPNFENALGYFIETHKF